ncbi:adenosylmethionine-8-amino-7-oxononanoate aminotransferase [Dioszegia hungarica]|uniref:Adenosylmethionine-8-amino-7-oxononanoate aminotransferase n=1 Tax=Dioszegia hungarica TaxID=4972 RepID=A0AA38HAJ6_9TREE|nr:adenosylmethionine-8-amino-7-oxononanoate aminotransferase [Dioszegia hungarica]KAI9635794.1 adenosylmethionine-8-amino-7-oxononanoate aminotransferase [Dioszegia hungarica]
MAATAILPEGVAATTKVFHRKLNHEPLFIDRAEGVYLYEAKTGRKILDGCGGAAVVSVGHAVPEIVKAVSEQIGRLPYISSATFAHQEAEELAEMFCIDSGMSRALFLTGGSEAAESAIKLCRQYHVENGESERVNYIARQKSYHGTTLATLSLGRHGRRRAHFEPLFADVFHEVSPCYAYRHKLDQESDEQYVARLGGELDAKFQELGPGTVSAFFMEPVVGATTGCVPFVPGYMKMMRDVCDRHGALLVFDEIMCGFGRTGKLHAWQWEDCQPDVQILGKGVNGGYSPLSVVLMNEKVVDVFRKGSGAFMNGYTYQSSGVGCRAALECYKYIKKHNLVEQCHERGLLLEKLLNEKILPHPNVGDVRGKGLFWGVELIKNKATKEPFPADHPVADLITAEAIRIGAVVYPGMKGAADGVLGDHVMLCPPYTISEDELEYLVDVLVESIKAVLG